MAPSGGRNDNYLSPGFCAFYKKKLSHFFGSHYDPIFVGALESRLHHFHSLASAKRVTMLGVWSGN